MTKRFVPWIVSFVFVLYLAASMVSVPLRADSRFDLAGFGRLPVALSGRVQPFDSVARIALSRIRGSATVAVERGSQGANRAGVPDAAAPSHSRTLGADEWLLEVLAKPDVADTRKIFPIDDPTLIAKLALGKGASRPTYYAFQDLATKVSEIGKETQRVGAERPEKRVAWEQELVGLQMKLAIYERLKNSVQPNSLLQLQAKGKPVTFDFAEELGKFRIDLQEAVRIAGRRKNGGTETLDAPTEQRIRNFAGSFMGVSRLGLLAAIPPVQPANPRAPWMNTGTAIVDSARGGRLSASVPYVARIVSAFAHGDAQAFNDRVTKYRSWLVRNGLSAQVQKARYETFYNVFQPFVRAVFVYGVGLVLLVVAYCSGGSTRSRMAYRSALMLVVLGLALHTMGLVFALMLGGQPGFASFAGWAVALMALSVEWFRRRGVGTAAAAVTGFAVLVLAFGFTAGGTASLARNVLDVRLLVAMVATLGLVWLAGRLSTTNVIERDHMSYASYLIGRRPLRTQ